MCITGDPILYLLCGPSFVVEAEMEKLDKIWVQEVRYSKDIV